MENIQRRRRENKFEKYYIDLSILFCNSQQEVYKQEYGKIDMGHMATTKTIQYAYKFIIFAHYLSHQHHRF